MDAKDIIIIGQLHVSASIQRDKIMSCLTPVNRKYVRDPEWELQNHSFHTSDCLQLLSIASECTV